MLQAVARRGSEALSARLGALQNHSHGPSQAQLDGFKSRALCAQPPALRHLYTTEWHRIEDAGALPQIMPLLGPGAKLGSERAAGSGAFKERTARHSRLKV